MIRDTAENPVFAFSTTINATQSKMITTHIDCVTGFFLSCDPVDDLTVEARKVGDVSWVDIEATPIDLSADAGTRQEYEIRLTAGSPTEVEIKDFSLRVG